MALKIDMHTHIIPERLPDWAGKFGYDGFIQLEHREAGVADMMRGGHFFRRIRQNCWDGALRVSEYEKFNTQVQVVCTIPVLFSYWAKPADCYDISRFLNDDIVELVAKYPKNYIGLGTVPMQDAEFAIKELERIKELGMPGIQIGSNINDLNLNEACFFPIFEACEALDLAVFVHPWNMMGGKSIEKYWLPWLVGMPAETARAACSLIFGGVMERLPSVRFCFAHAGGSFIPTIGRIEHGFNCRPDLVAVDNPINPRDYIGKFWIDSVTHDAALLRYLLDIVPSNKIALGSDYPFPLGDLEIGAFIEEMGLPTETIEDIFCNSTLDWLKLDKQYFV